MAHPCFLCLLGINTELISEFLLTNQLLGDCLLLLAFKKIIYYSTKFYSHFLNCGQGSRLERSEGARARG